MIMKLNVSNELKSRLMHAAENGSVIAIPVSRTGTTRRHPGSRRTGQFWNPPRLLNCSRTCPSTHPTKSIISVAPSHWTAKSRSGCMKA